MCQVISTKANCNPILFYKSLVNVYKKHVDLRYTILYYQMKIDDKNGLLY